MVGYRQLSIGQWGETRRSSEPPKSELETATDDYMVMVMGWRSKKRKTSAACRLATTTVCPI